MSARKLRWRKDGKRDLSLQDAVWQYILDHVSSIGPKGYVVCTIGLVSKEQFFRSLESRKLGKYRWSEEDIQNMYTKLYEKDNLDSLKI